MTEKKDAITMLHGAGGTVMHDLVKNYVVKYFGGLGNAEVPLEAMDDAAVVGDVVFKSDSHAVKPIFFPGGDIGRLAISGTVNDIAVWALNRTLWRAALFWRRVWRFPTLRRFWRACGKHASKRTWA